MPPRHKIEAVPVRTSSTRGPMITETTKVQSVRWHKQLPSKFLLAMDSNGLLLA
jgi:hypothetical protein